MTAAIWHDLLDRQQLAKFGKLTAWLKSKPDEWFAVEALDTSVLPRGARIAAFPREWLEHFTHINRHKYSQYDIKLTSAGNGSTGLSFSIRFKCHAPQTEDELLSMLRYPAADVDVDEADDDSFCSDEEDDLAVSSSVFLQDESPQSAVAMRVVDNACANGLALAIPLALQKQTASGTLPGDMAGDASGVDLAEEREFNLWWTSSPLVVRSKHIDGLRHVSDLAHDTLPQGIAEHDRLVLEWRRRQDHPLNRRRRPHPFERSYTLTITASPPTVLRFEEQPQPAGRASEGRWTLTPAGRAVAALKTDVGGLRSLVISMVRDETNPTLDKLVRLRFAVDEVVGTSTNRITESHWAMRLLWSSTVFGKKRLEYRLFRRELTPPISFPEEHLLHCFGRSIKSLRTKRDREGDDAAPSTPSTGRHLSDAWWANASPAVTRIACANRPTGAELAAAAKSSIVPVSMTHAISGEILTVPDVVVSVGDDASGKKRRRFRDLRNTHMIHMGLDLQKEQISLQHLRYRPLQF